MNQLGSLNELKRNTLVVSIWPKKTNYKGIHTEETRRERDTPMFIAALFIIARTWKNLDAHQQMNG